MFAGRTIYRAFDLYYPVFALYLFESPVFLRKNDNEKWIQIVVRHY